MDFDKLIEYQNLLQNQLRTEESEDKKIKLLTIINHLTNGPKNLVQKEQIIIEAMHQGFNEKEIEIILKRLKEDKIIYESTPGYIKKR
jgi:DNA replicative helicase MCM subunit Mcm2 (Cdc46/Mcm family)